MAVASYNTTIKAGGTPTTMTDEDMSVVTGNQYPVSYTHLTLPTNREV